jgi:alpha-glucoside transport system substrate-binding protein
MEELAGRTVRVAGRWTGGERASFDAVNERFTKFTGVRVTYDVLSNPEALMESLAADRAPDVAFIDQPELMHELAETNRLVRFWPELVDRMQENLAPTWVELGSHNGVPYGLPYQMAVKSLVWYPRQAFEAAGYEAPRNWEELIALTNRMVADGRTPWCIGIETGGATGWVATDWMEDLVLRTGGPEVYDLWTAHEIPFNSDPILVASEHIAEIWFNPAYVRGGRNAIAGTHFVDASLAMWEEPPGCYLHRQGDSIVQLWPEEIQNQLDERVGFFPLPSVDERWGQPLLVAGDQAVVLDDRPEVRAYLEYVAGGDSVEPWARAGGATSPHRDQDLGWYPTEVDREIAELLVGAEIARYDASDQMPSEVGMGSFFVGMTEWVNGAPLPEVLAEIDAGWPPGGDEPLAAEGCQDGDLRVALVVEPGLPAQASFGLNAWDGLLRADETLAVCARMVESSADENAQPVIRELARQEYDLIMAVGFRFAEAMVDVAPEFPDSRFVIVDAVLDPAPPNVQQVLFSVDQATFPAGYLAAAWADLQDPEEPQVGWVGGEQIEPVEQFIAGYEAGVTLYNRQKGRDIGVRGTYVGSFAAPEEGSLLTSELIDEGVDVIFAAAGETGIGVLLTVQERGRWGIGVDVDQYETLPEARGILLTSCIKRLDSVVYAVVESVARGTFAGGSVYVGTMENGGVGLAPFHEFEEQLPDWLKLEIEEIKQAIARGELETGW